MAIVTDLCFYRILPASKEENSGKFTTHSGMSAEWNIGELFNGITDWKVCYVCEQVFQEPVTVQFAAALQIQLVVR